MKSRVNEIRIKWIHVNQGLGVFENMFDSLLSDLWTKSKICHKLCHASNIEFFPYIYPAKFDNFKDDKISDYKTVSAAQSKNFLYSKLLV